MAKTPKSTNEGRAEAGPSFEKALERLEKIIQDLEEGELELDASLKLFEEGVGLSKLCQKKLEEAEARVELLLQDPEGNLERVPFEGAEDSEEGS